MDHEKTGAAMAAPALKEWRDAATDTAKRSNDAPIIIQTYTLETVIGRNGYTIELIATSERAAISRARGTMFHKLQDWRAMEAEYVVTEVYPFRPTDTTVEHTP